MGHFGINTNIYETNIINQIILLIGLYIVYKKLIQSSIDNRQAKIINSIENSEKCLIDAKIRLEEAKKQFSQIILIVEKIKIKTNFEKLELLKKEYTDTTKKFNTNLNHVNKTVIKTKYALSLKIKKRIATLALKKFNLKNNKYKLPITNEIDNHYYYFMRNSFKMLKFIDIKK
jgi:F-type H+-transporting ATPase subunit b